MSTVALQKQAHTYVNVTAQAELRVIYSLQTLHLHSK